MKTLENILIQLTISSHVYSFQEGIRKLILLRPAFTHKMFERLIAKIDALINFEDMPVETYEEQLCEEWFKDKVASIANTRKAEHQVQIGQYDIAIDESNKSRSAVCCWRQGYYV